ncbi:MAG: MFS transporter [Alphaproteobacteria bacterium]|nr:MFS transporter [Alphaproteobacteria bacterium]
MLPLSFLRAHGRLIGFGFFMYFCSSAGQTFYISLFGGELRAAFDLSHGGFGTIYAAATFASAATLVWAGRLIDRVPLPFFAAAVMAGLAGVSLLMGAVWSAGALTAALFGLRLFGQGLAGHTAGTAMARYFDAERGRALGIAVLGLPAGKFVLPALVVAGLAVTGWREVWAISGFALLALAPLVFVLLKGHGARDDALRARRAKAASEGAADSTLGVALRDPGLWLRLPALLAPPAIFTGLVFHQVHLADSKGWSLTLIAGSFTVFAVASVAATVLSGPLVDRLSARRLVPLFLAPIALSCLALALGDAPVAAPVFLALLGLGTGISFVLSGTLWPELYGTAHLGAIKSFVGAAMVFSTGLAPAVMGVLFDRGISVESVAAACALYCVAASALAATARGAGRFRIEEQPR